MKPARYTSIHALKIGITCNEYQRISINLLDTHTIYCHPQRDLEREIRISPAGPGPLPLGESEEKDGLFVYNIYNAFNTKYSS